MRTRARKIWQSEKGFTIIENMLAIGLAILLVYAIWQFYRGYTTKFSQISEVLETAIDIESGQRIMFKDLKSIDPSFGLLQLMDDNKRNFFDYYPDVPEERLEKDPETGRPSRVFTMKLQGGYTEIVMILQDPLASEIPSLLYDPTRAYTITPGPIGMAGNVTFKGVNSGGYVKGMRDVVTEGFGANLKVLYKGYWNEGQLLLFDTPILFRSAGQLKGDLEAPRSPAFLGRVVTGSGPPNDFVPVDPIALETHKARPGNDDRASLGGPVEQGGTLNRSHPVVPTMTIDSADKFLRWLPAAGGGQPMVRLRPIKLVKYYIRAMYPNIKPDTKDPAELKKKDLVRLYKQVYTTGQWDPKKGATITNTFIVAENLKTVQFKRDTVTSKAVLFDISKSEIK